MEEGWVLELLSIRERIEREEKTIEELRRRRQMREAADAAKKSTFDAQTSTDKDTSGASLSIRDIGISLRSPQKGYAAIGHTTTIGLDRSQPPLPTTRPPPTPPKPPSLDETSRSPSTIQINTFGEGQTRRSVTNLAAVRDGHQGSASELFHRPESSISTSTTKTQPAHRRLLSVIPDEVDRSVGSSTLLDNDYMGHASSTASTYARDAEVRLNLFMNDPGKESETTV
ncbi:unnamed protein product, partial [Mesorhabditis spiculigera]